MKEINELAIPQDVCYTSDHEWARLDGETVRIGVTDYAQDRLGETSSMRKRRRWAED